MGDETIIGLCFVCWLVLFYAPVILYFKFGWFKFWYHDVFHWHRPDDKPEWSDGLSFRATCKYCGKDIMQDSQGNWF